LYVVANDFIVLTKQEKFKLICITLRCERAFMEIFHPAELGTITCVFIMTAW